MESALDHSENVLNLGSDGGLFPFTALDLRFGTDGRVFGLRRPAIDFIPDFFAVLISQYGIFPLFGPEIPTVAMDGLFLPSEQYSKVSSKAVPLSFQ